MFCYLLYPTQSLDIVIIHMSDYQVTMYSARLEQTPSEFLVFFNFNLLFAFIYSVLQFFYTVFIVLRAAVRAPVSLAVLFGLLVLLHLCILYTFMSK